MNNFIGRMWNIFVSNFDAYLQGTWNTILISMVGTLIGLVIGIFVGIILTIPEAKGSFQRGLQKVVNFILRAYIALFRGTPMIVQSMVIYYGSAILYGIDMSPMTAAFIIVSINTGAYMAVVVEGGILSVDQGQKEGAKSIGMNHWQTMREVVLPQAMKNITPSIANEFVINLKDTSVLNVISVNELYFTTNTIASTNYLFFETFFVTAIIYFILTFLITNIIAWIERKTGGADSYELYTGQPVASGEEVA